MSACTFLYLVIFSVRYLDAQLLVCVQVKNPKNSNTAGIKIPPDVASNSLSAQFPRM